MSLVLGVDSSTQSTKVEARDIESGAVVARSSAPHPATEPPVSEQDPRAWWAALSQAIAALEIDLGQVVALSVAGQQHGLVLLDEHDDPLRPAKLWNDTTSAPQADRIVEALGASAWAQRCGSVPLASFTISKLAWVAEHEPELLERTARVMLPHDYLTYRLTGRNVTDRGDASGTGWFDGGGGGYRADLLATAGVDADWLDRLPHVLGPTEAAGTLTPDTAAELGLSTDTVVGPGSGDNMGAALGLGLQPGDVAMSLGTSGTVYAVARAGTADERGFVAGFADAAGGFLPLVCTLNATKVTDTIASWLGTDATGLADLALAAPSSFSGVVLLPYFDGERTPNRPDATGGFSGLRNSTTREQLALAAHDGVLCGLFGGLDALRSTGVEMPGRLHLIGGGARSAAYRQRAADLHGSPIVVPEVEEAVATGAALQAAAVATEHSLAGLAEAWGLTAGRVVEPAVDVDRLAVLEAYRSVAT